MDEETLPKSPDTLCALLNYSFKNRELLIQALRHPSYVYEKGDPEISDNQRLEFLGDAVINLAISHLLVKNFPEMKEGELSKYRASLVSESGLHSITRELNLGDYLLLGKGEERTNGRKKPSILSDTIEALIGAIYLDGNFASTIKVIALLFGPLLNTIGPGKSINDFKTELQEYSQETFQSIPQYRLQRETGPDHNKTFYVSVYLNETVMGEGKGKSKKEAEQKAAEEALNCLKR